jgi:four helix bundle protein
MQFGHAQLDGYRVSIQYVAWAYHRAKRLKGIDRHARDQLLRASQFVPLNIAEGNGKGTNADRRRCFEVARGSALACASIQDCLKASDALTASQDRQGKTLLVEMAQGRERTRHVARALIDQAKEAMILERVTLGMELKVWRDGAPDPLTDGLAQLDGYLAGLGRAGGWLVIFDRRSGQSSKYA